MGDIPSSRLTWYNVAIILSLSLGSMSYGYDFSIITFTIGQPAWYEKFGMTTNPSQHALYTYSNNIIGALLGLFSAGAIFGAVFVGWMCDVHGRKKSLILAAIINIVGGALQTGSVHIAMFAVARFVTGFAAAMFVTLVSIYIAEVAPPSTRGLLVGQHGAFFLFGYTVAAWVSVGSFFNTGQAEFQWRFPLALQCLWPLLHLLFVLDLPESPRWLLSHDRADEAWRILRQLHFNPENKHGSEQFAKEEFNQIKAQITMDLATYGEVSILDLFRKPHFAKRMFCAAIVMFTSQACGNVVIYNNAAILFKGLGFDDARALVLSAAYITWACVCNFANSTFLDKLGRVRSLVIGIASGGIMVAIEAAIVAKYGSSNNRSALAAGVAVLFMYITTFAGFCDTTLYVYCSEIFPTHIRAKGMAWSISMFMLSTIPFSESSTIGFATIGWKYYMIFIAFAVVCSVTLHTFCPETKGLSLEEINMLFGDEVAVQLTRISGQGEETLDKATVSTGALESGHNPSLKGSGVKAHCQAPV